MIHVEAYDWNCPQHITPRYTAEEIREGMQDVEKRMESLEQENAALRKELAAARPIEGLKDIAYEFASTPTPVHTRDSHEKVRLAEDGWNTRDPEKVALAYTVDSRWRNRAEFLNGREQIMAFLKRKWTQRAGLPAHQGVVGIHRQPYRGAFCLRISR